MQPLVGMAVENAENNGLAVLIPPVYEIFWSAVVFLVIWAVLGWALPKIYKMIDKRQEEIDAGLRAAETAKEDAALAARERREIVNEANEQARQIRERADREGKRVVADARQAAQSEAARIEDAAQRQIAAEREAAAQSLRADVGALATDLAEKIIGEQLKDKALSDRVIDRFMDDLESEMDRAAAQAAEARN